MIFRKCLKFTGALAILTILGLTGNVSAKEDVSNTQHKNGLKTTASGGCNPGSIQGTFLDINNVKAKLMTGGDMWWDIGLQNAAYFIPSTTAHTSQFAASCWIGGYDAQGNLKVAGQTYRQSGNDFWPGALDGNAQITEDTCQLWDEFWKVDKSTVNQFIQLQATGANVSSMSQFSSIFSWPAVGNHNVIGADGKTLLSLYPGFSYASFKDLNGDGLYEPEAGEYPVLESNGVQSLPDEIIWWVFNDAGNVKQMSLTAAIGVEVQTTAFAYSTQDFLNNSTFYNYRVINRGALEMDSTYIAVWDDCDLGWYDDDFIGCDTLRGLGIQYNGTNCDGCAAGNPADAYGENPPQVGLDFFQGPLKPIVRVGKPDTVQRLKMTNFTYYNNDASVIGNPTNGIQMYGYMTGTIRNGQHFTDDHTGPTPSKGYGSGPDVNAIFWDDPSDPSGWSECACNNNPGDRRFIFSSGPFVLKPGAINDITFGCLWAPPPVGGCPVTNFTTIRSLADQAHALFESHFKTVEGPNAPRLAVRELDRKLIFYMVNDANSNNYNEAYGDTSGTYKDSLQYHQVAAKAVAAGSPDSLYQFEGYQVFQLANSTVTPAQIFDPNTGEVDNSVAFQVFQCDIHNGVTQIVNYVPNTSVVGSNDTIYNAQIKVSGKDSGITHSFVITQDQFAGSNTPTASNADKVIINYQTYYYVAVAYAHNNFVAFDPRNSETTQDIPYLGSTHGEGGIDIQVVAAMPNPVDSALGMVLNSAYGSGVSITRVEGVGNGGNFLQMNTASENTILQEGNGDSIANPTYNVGEGPLTVKVVDPVRVSPYTWALQIGGASSGVTGIAGSAMWQLTAFNSGGQQVATIYSESDIALPNEQILEQYGISVTVGQTLPPGLNNTYGNGLIATSITFSDSAMTWLYGVQSTQDSTYTNWIRSGSVSATTYTGALNPVLKPCNFIVNPTVTLDPQSNYFSLLSNFSPTKSTWAPYDLAAWYEGDHANVSSQCPFEIAYTDQTQTLASFETLPDVDIVFTSDKTKWTRCAVVEMEDDPAFAQGYSAASSESKFLLRQHAGWDMDYTGTNTPVYSDDTAENGMSWFPGYAINEGTGQRLNIAFGENSLLVNDNGADMLWNPTSREFDTLDGTPIFGGMHVVYVLGTKYDSDKQFAYLLKSYGSNPIDLKTAYTLVQWIGYPMLGPNIPLASIADGIIPTTTRLSFRVNRPYAPLYEVGDTSATSLPGRATGVSAVNPYYTFSTVGLAPSAISDTTNRKNLLSQIQPVPNPYYGYSGYEQNHLSTDVRIINLPADVTIYIYSLDGELIRTLTKSDPSTPYIDWDIKNSAGLPISSGMYLMDVKAVGIGEVVLKWFGAMRPLDVTSY